MCFVSERLALFNKAGGSVALRFLGTNGSADQTLDFPVEMVDPATVRVFAPAEGPALTSGPVPVFPDVQAVVTDGASTVWLVTGYGPDGTYAPIHRVTVV